MTDPRETLHDYSVVFYMEGISKRFEYEVSKGTYDSLRQGLEDDDIGNLVFAAYRPAEQIVINSRFVQLAHFLWQPRGEGGWPFSREAPERRDTIDLYFAGREEPVRLETDDPDEVFDLVLAMETEAFPRCSVVDANGEEAVLDLRKLVCAEVPLGLAKEGEAHALAELEEGA